MSRGANPNAGVNLAQRENRVGLGLGSNPLLPPGVALPSSVNLRGAAENTGNPSFGMAAARALANSGGISPGKARGPRGVEKPSLARSNAISRRLGGNPSKGTELKGL